MDFRQQGRTGQQGIVQLCPLQHQGIGVGTARQPDMALPGHGQNPGIGRIVGHGDLPDPQGLAPAQHAQETEQARCHHVLQHARPGLQVISMEGQAAAASLLAQADAQAVVQQGGVTGQPLQGFHQGVAVHHQIAHDLQHAGMDGLVRQHHQFAVFLAFRQPLQQLSHQGVHGALGHPVVGTGHIFRRDTRQRIQTLQVAVFGRQQINEHVHQ